MGVSKYRTLPNQSKRLQRRGPQPPLAQLQPVRACCTSFKRKVLLALLHVASPSDDGSQDPSHDSTSPQRPEERVSVPQRASHLCQPSGSQPSLWSSTREHAPAITPRSRRTPLISSHRAPCSAYPLCRASQALPQPSA